MGSFVLRSATAAPMLTGALIETPAIAATPLFGLKLTHPQRICARGQARSGAILISIIDGCQTIVIG